MPHGHAQLQWQIHARRQGPWLLTHDSSRERAGKAGLCAPDRESYRRSPRRSPPVWAVPTGEGRSGLRGWREGTPNTAQGATAERGGGRSDGRLQVSQWVGLVQKRPGGASLGDSTAGNGRRDELRLERNRTEGRKMLSFPWWPNG